MANEKAGESGSGRGSSIRPLLRVTALIHGLITAVFVLAALVLLVVAVHTGFMAVYGDGFGARGAQGVIEAIGLITIAVAALQIAQTIGEEEVIREAHMSGPTRARRFLSRFMVVIVVALAIEGLVATFKAVRENHAMLMPAAAIIAAVGLLLAGWGLFIRLNVAAEALEPEAMRQAKEEDRKLQPDSH